VHTSPTYRNACAQQAVVASALLMAWLAAAPWAAPLADTPSARAFPASVSGPAALVPADDLVARILSARPQAGALASNLQAEIERSSAVRSGPYEWSVGLGLGRRQSRGITGARSQDASIAIERPVRMWGKEEADRQLAAAGEERAQREAALGYRDLKALFIQHWAEYLRSLALEEGARRNLESARQLLRQAEVRHKVGEIAQVDVQLARAEFLQAQAQGTDAQALQSAAASRVKALYPLLPLPEQLPGTLSGWQEALAGRIAAIPAQAQAADLLFAQRNPSVLVNQSRTEEQRRLAQRLDLDRRPDPTLGGYLLNEASGGQSVIGVHLSLPITGNFRAASARAAEHVAASTRLVGEESTAQLRAELGARWAAWKLRQSLLAQRWQAADLHREAALRSLRAFALGERSVAELVQLQRIADEQYTLALTQSVELLTLQLGLAMDLGLIWDPGS